MAHNLDVKVTPIFDLEYGINGRVL